MQEILDRLDNLAEQVETIQQEADIILRYIRITRAMVQKKIYEEANNELP